jgi:CBS domain-containing protein
VNPTAVPGRTARPFTVADVMTRAPATCSPGASLADAARIMWDRDCGFVPVTDDSGSLRGVVTDRDACMAAFTRGLPLAAIPVGTAMSGDVASVREGDSVAHAHDLMRTRRVRRLPVLDGRDRVVGVLSLNDLALAGERREPEPREVAATLGAVSEHREVAKT